MQEVRRSLLSSTDSCRNPAESGQFPEFRRNQIWQRGLPNSYNDSNGILNKIQILPEWFWESPGWNAQERNPFLHCLQCQRPNRALAFADARCRHLIWALSTALNPTSPLPPSSSTTTIQHAASPLSPTATTIHGLHPPPSTTTAGPRCSNDTPTPRRLLTHHTANKHP